jgi:PAS domain S-box-containing protein
LKTRARGIAHHESALRAFVEAVDKGKTRADHVAGPSSDLVQDRESLRVALEELRVHHEELTVAGEEMRAQLEELSAATTRAQVERDRYRELFDLGPDGYFVTDRAGLIRDVNKEASRLLSIEARFLLGKPLVVLVDKGDARMLRSGIESVRRGTPIELHVRMKPRGSEPAWYSLKSVSIDGGNGILWIARDIHARYAEHPNARVAHGDLGAVAAARLEALERANRDKTDLLERERDLRMQLEEAHFAKDRLLAVLSHDLRAPLNAVLGWTQLLRRETLDRQARDSALATIERAARAHQRLLEELLDIARLDAAGGQLEQVATNIDELVQRCVDAMAPAAHDAGVQLRRSRQHERLVVAGDPRRLEQVFVNLLDNALKATPRGGTVNITVGAEGEAARIVVEDTGRGIAPHALTRLFSAFRERTEHVAGGDTLGLGLYLARRAVDLHGGSISAESEGIGKGARFTVTLPLVTRRGPKAQPLPPPPSSGPASAGPPSAGARTGRPLEGIRVLVVDDEEDARDLLAALLRQRGAVVTTAPDVAAALVAFEPSPPDVLVSDLGMPGRSGFDLARELRASPTASDAALVAVSGFSSPEEIARALDAGFDVHLAKPVEPAELVNAIREAAAAKRSAR